MLPRKHSTYILYVLAIIRGWMAIVRDQEGQTSKNSLYHICLSWNLSGLQPHCQACCLFQFLHGSCKQPVLLICLFPCSDSIICQRHHYPSSLAVQKTRKTSRPQSSLKVSISRFPLLPFSKLNFLFQVIVDSYAVERNIAERAHTLYPVSCNCRAIAQYHNQDIDVDAVY